jgi:hypothetical protein
MSFNSSYDEAIKKLEITPVDKQTGLKAETWTKAKDIRKLQYSIELPIFSYSPKVDGQLNPDGTGYPWLWGQFVAQFNYEMFSNFRILNYEKLSEIWRYNLGEGNYIACLRYKLDGVAYRYKLIGNKTSSIRTIDSITAEVQKIYTITSDNSVDSSRTNPNTTPLIIPYTFIPSEWYTGQLINSVFVIEIYCRFGSITSNTFAINEQIKLLNTSRIKTPSFLTEEAGTIQPVKIVTAADASIPWYTAFPITVNPDLITT